MTDDNNGLIPTISGLDAYKRIDKSEMTNLMLQVLSDFGLSETSDKLKQEFSQKFEANESITRNDKLIEFLENIKAGEFHKAQLLIGQLPLNLGMVPNNHLFSPFDDLEWINNNPDKMNPGNTNEEIRKLNKTRFITKQIELSIRKQKFLESLIIEKDSKKSLKVLKNEINSMENISKKEIDILSSLIIDESSNIKYLESHGFSSEVNVDYSRNFLINLLSKFIKPDELLPPHRLLTLLNQAHKYQNSMNLISLNDGEIIENNNVEKNDWSLYDDYQCTGDKIPCKVIQTVTHKSKQIWYVKFSHNGKFLAVLPNDSSIIIYNVGDFSNSKNGFKVHKILLGHSKEVLYCSWSSNDEKLLTGGFDAQLKIWDVKTGSCLKTLNIKKNRHQKDPSSPNASRTFGSNHEPPPLIKACAWLPNGEGFVAGSTESALVYFNSKGEEIFDWSGMRIIDLCVTADSKKLLVISKTKLAVFDLTIKRKIKEINIGHSCTSLLLSKKNPNHVLINKVPDSIQLWDYEMGIMIKNFRGQKQEHNIIRSCLNASETLLLSGSEDGKIYIWNKKFGALIMGLKSHKKLVNCVDFNPQIPWMFASGSDDETVKIWGSNKILRQINGTIDKTFDNHSKGKNGKYLESSKPLLNNEFEYDANSTDSDASVGDNNNDNNDVDDDDDEEMEVDSR